MRADLKRIVAAARAEGRWALLESEGLELAEALGLRAPRRRIVRDAAAARRLEPGALPGDRVVVKVLSPEIAHKTEAGGVEVVANDVSAIVDSVVAMERRLAVRAVRGFLIEEFVAHDGGLGGELLVGLRWTEDFGPVVTLGAGGIDAEFLASAFRPGTDLVVLSPALADLRVVRDALAASVVGRLASEERRGKAPRIAPGVLADALVRLCAFAQDAMPDDLTELEFNPIVPTSDGLVVLDALARLGAPRPADARPRPLAKLRRLLEPRSIALVGVSEKLNPGHVILNNVIREGFPPERVFVVKPGVDSIEGCACVPDVASLPECVDLFVVSVDAAQVPRVVREAILHRKAESLILIPGGLGEREGTEEHVRAVHDALRAARATEWGGPVLNGGNCLGVRSRPGRYDTLFIPEHKLGFSEGIAAPYALLAQSGAFAVARSSSLQAFVPKYVVTVGNQVDLTVGDYLTYLADDPEIAVFACYVEGFRPLDGRRFVEAAARIARSGRAVVLYRAGRTAAGVAATASHTASIAGDYAVTRALATQAGVLVAETLGEFDDLVRTALLLRDKRVDGLRLGAVSNAGFECVAIADHAGPFTLAEFGASTRERLDELLERLRLSAIVGVHDPLDLTPIAGDAAYDEASRAVLEDPDVDVGVIGCVPMTGALETLGDEIVRERSVAPRLARVFADCPKAAIAVVDGGAKYDAMARFLEGHGVPTFRRADRALRVFAKYCTWRLRTAR